MKRKENKKENKYFVVYDETTANVLKGATGQRYYIFTARDGSDAYSFVNDEKLQVALRLLSIIRKVDVDKLTII